MLRAAHASDRAAIEKRKEGGSPRRMAIEGSSLDEIHAGTCTK